MQTGNISSYLNFQPSQGFGPVDVPGGQMSRSGSGMYIINVPGWENSPIYYDPSGGQYYYTRQTGGIGPISEVKDAGWRNAVTDSFKAGLSSPAVQQAQGGQQQPQDKSLGTANIQGVGSVQLSQNAQGQTYYTQGGNRYALSPQALEQLGLPSIAGYDQQGNPYYTPSQNPSQVQSTMQLPSSLTKADGNWSPEFVNWLQSNAGKDITVNGARTTVPKAGTPEAIKWTQQLIDDVNNKHAAIGDSSGNSIYSSTPLGATSIRPKTVTNPANPGDTNPTPEGAALAQLQKTDPGTYNIISQLQKYYGTEGKNIANPAQQNALDTYYQGQAQAINKGLDPTTTRQIQQDSRAAQLARGNALGSSQAVQEALTTGQAGINLRSQEAQNLGSYLTSRGQNVGSYLNSGTTPAAMGSRQLSDLINQASSANGAGATPFQSTYNPQNTFTYFNPQSGQQFAQGAQNWYNAANYQYLGSGAAGGALSPGMSAGSGALSGAMSGALAGSTFGPYGTLIGGGVGALAGGLGGYAGGGGFGCWIARAVYGDDNPKWKVFRDWLIEDAPKWFASLYRLVGPTLGPIIRKLPFLKKLIRPYMDKIIIKKLRQEVYR